MVANRNLGLLFLFIKSLSVRSNEIGQVITFPSYDGIVFNRVKKQLDTKINFRSIY